MREILFKAKRLDNGEWVEGYVFDDGFVDSTRRFIGDIIITDYKGNADDKWEILGTNLYEVIPETICQYTGLTDKNGNKIWENDVVRKYDTNALGWARVRNCKISFDKLGYWLLTTQYGDGYWLGEFDADQLEVIGNIFDNPELLKNE